MRTAVAEPGRRDVLLNIRDIVDAAAELPSITGIAVRHYIGISAMLPEPLEIVFTEPPTVQPILAGTTRLTVVDVPGMKLRRIAVEPGRLIVVVDVPRLGPLGLEESYGGHDFARLAKTLTLLALILDEGVTDKVLNNHYRIGTPGKHYRVVSTETDVAEEARELLLSVAVLGAISRWRGAAAISIPRHKDADVNYVTLVQTPGEPHLLRVSVSGHAVRITDLNTNTRLTLPSGLTVPGQGFLADLTTHVPGRLRVIGRLWEGRLQRALAGLMSYGKQGS